MVAENTVMEGDPEQGMALNGDNMATGVECTIVGIVGAAVTMEAACIMDLTSGHLDTGVSSAKMK